MKILSWEHMPGKSKQGFHSDATDGDAIGAIICSLKNILVSFFIMWRMF